MNPADIYNQIYNEVLEKLVSQKLDPNEPQVKKIAREMARAAVNRASRQ
jgi:DNA-binding transcriptional regulator YhcF (GntR family)